MKMTRVADVPSVCSILPVRWWRTKHDVSLPVPRPAHRGLRLYRGGLCVNISAFAPSILIVLQKKCPNNTVAIAHDDDLRLIKDIVRLTPDHNAAMKTDDVHSQDILHADAVEGYLRQNETRVVVKNGGICPITLRVAW